MGKKTTFLPTKCKIRSCTIEGVNITQYVQNIKVYESMCTPYIKADLTIIDNNGIIVGIADGSPGSLAGAEIKFAFDAGEVPYEQTQYILTVDGQPSEQNKRIQVYNIGTIGISYVKDRATLVQSTVQGQTAIQKAMAVHTEYVEDQGIGITSDSQGMVGTDKQSYHISNVKPFKAIEDLLKRAVYPQWAPPTVYFRNADMHIMGPLEQIFATAAPNYDFIEAATWASDYRNMFGDSSNAPRTSQGAHDMIMAATVIVKEDDLKKSRTNLHNIASSAFQAHRVFDSATHGRPMNLPAVPSGIGSLLSALSGIGSNMEGGSQNIHILDSLRQSPSTDPVMQRPREQEFLARVQDADKYLVKVPIKNGLKLTVGQGVNARILAPAGDQIQHAKLVGGLMLCADVMHDVYFDIRTVMGTTTFRGVVVKDVI